MAKKGLTLLEILIAFVIFVILIAGAAATYVSIERLNREIGYYYTAWNLTKEMLEFGEGADNFGHSFAMKYYFRPASSNTLPDLCSNAGLCTGHNCSVVGQQNCATGRVNQEGYGLKEWKCFLLCDDTRPGRPARPQPFLHLGDIKTKGLVPKNAPDSVEIYYLVEPDPNFKDAAGKPVIVNGQPVLRETAEVSWQDEPGGRRKKVIASVVPIRHVNNQLRLEVASFDWE